MLASRGRDAGESLGGSGCGRLCSPELVWHEPADRSVLIERVAAPVSEGGDQRPIPAGCHGVVGFGTDDEAHPVGVEAVEECDAFGHVRALRG